jgi:ADP-ribose pyrophosphatase YjhB (NUDIX family)
MTKRTYCYICANKLEQKTDTSWWCAHCQQLFFDNPRPCAELLLLNRNREVLLVQREKDPWKDKFDLPGGFMEPNETVLESLWREMKEELGLTAPDTTIPQFLQSWAADYPYGQEVHPTITFTFWAELISDRQLMPLDELSLPQVYMSLITMMQEQQR